MRHCAVCVHPERRRIELKRANGASLEALAAEFGLHRDQIWRHWTRHVSDEAKATFIAGPLKIAELKERAAAENLSLLDYMSIIRTTLIEQFCAASEAKAYNHTVNIAGRLIETLKEIGKLTGEVQRYTSTVNNVTNIAVFSSPDFARLQSGLIEALAPYPDARSAVIRKLRDMENEAKGENLIEAKGGKLIEGVVHV
jgi:hypothetical protein